MEALESLFSPLDDPSDRWPKGVDGRSRNQRS